MLSSVACSSVGSSEYSSFLHHWNRHFIIISLVRYDTIQTKPTTLQLQSQQLAGLLVQVKPGLELFSDLARHKHGNIWYCNKQYNDFCQIRRTIWTQLTCKTGTVITRWIHHLPRKHLFLEASVYYQWTSIRMMFQLRGKKHIPESGEETCFRTVVLSTVSYSFKVCQPEPSDFVLLVLQF